MLFLVNPIFQREFSSSSRSVKVNFLIWAYLVLLALVILILWPAGGIHSVASSSSKQIFTLFFSVNLTLVLLMVPAFAATSISWEKENNTYDSLFITMMKPHEIMQGKLFSSILVIVILVLLSIPIASVCALTGGISILLVTKIVFLILVTAVSYGLAGLACSAWFSRSSSSIVMNYAVMMFFAGASWLPAALLSNIFLLQKFKDVWQLVRCISPYDAMFYLLYPETYRLSMETISRGDTITPYGIFIAFSIVFSMVSFGLFARGITRPAVKGKAIQGEFYTGARQAIKRKLTWPFYLIDPLKRKKTISNWSNPVFVAEMRSKLFANPKFALRLVSAIFILSLMILILVSWQYSTMLKADTVRIVAIVFQICVVALLAPGVSSGLITEEITSGTFLMLRMTPMKPYTVILGKLKATFFYALIFIVSSFFVIFAMAYLEQQTVFPDGSVLSTQWWSEVVQRSHQAGWYDKLWLTYKRIIIWIFILLLSTLTFLTGGLFASSVSKNTGMATALSYVITALICIVSLAPLVLVNKISDSLAYMILSFNPIAAAAQVTNNSLNDYPGLWKSNMVCLALLISFFLVAAMLRTWYLFRTRD
jgi:ABC-type transport system involved in multi-copper enzyme maturation permease subunit